MRTLESYVCGGWKKGEGELAKLYDPSTGTPVAEAGTAGIDMKSVLVYARNTGGDESDLGGERSEGDSR